MKDYCGEIFWNVFLLSQHTEAVTRGTETASQAEIQLDIVEKLRFWNTRGQKVIDECTASAVVETPVC